MAVIAIKKPQIYRITIKAEGGENEFELPCLPVSKEELFVYLNGVLLEEGENKDFVYFPENSKIELIVPLAVGDILQIIFYR